MQSQYTCSHNPQAHEAKLEGTGSHRIARTILHALLDSLHGQAGLFLDARSTTTAVQTLGANSIMHRVKLEVSDV